MRILVVSDTHGSAEMIRKVVAQEEAYDAIVHCGDLEGQEDLARSMVDGPCYMVAGNNDWGSNLRSEIVTLFGDYRVMITHGHRYGVSLGPERLWEEARSRNVDICLFGHTHRPYSVTQDKLTLLNPGSLVRPRQIGRKCTYLTLTFDRDHEFHYQFGALED